MRLRALIRHVYGFVFATRLSSVTMFEKTAIKKLRATITAIEKNSPKVDGEANWLKNCRELREHILTKDPRKFLTWDVLYRTMFVSYEPWVGIELSALKTAGVAISEPKIGAPANYLFTGVSGNTIHQTYHCMQFANMSGSQLQSYNHIVEFGGGYGNLCRIILESGFKGSYTIVDFPEFLALQEFYLSIAFADKWSTLRKRISFVSDSSKIIPAKKRLVLAFWSLSESPVSVREKFFARVQDSDWFIGYQGQYYTLNNKTYFTGLAKKRGTFVEQELIPIPGNKYLFSRSKK